MIPTRPNTSAWARQPEGGPRLALSALLWLALRLGPGSARLLLPPLVAWHLVASAEACAASRDYLGRVLGRPVRLGDVARHFHSFAGMVLERVYLLSGRDAGFDIRIEGLEHVTRILASGQGCVLLGSHLGSFEALRGIARLSPVPVRPMMYRRNAGALTALLDRLAPGLRDSVIDIGEPDSMLRAKEALGRGEMVGLLADRSPEAERRVMVPFLGSPAAFPAGPFVLAATLGAPVVLFYGLRLGPCHYLVRFLPFDDRLVLRRTNRAEDLSDCIGRYAAALETACRAYPFNWFNFFPFWEQGQHAMPDPSSIGGPAPAAGETGGGAAHGA
jgi:predicted LPLAT superfamily acyltransferase